MVTELVDNAHALIPADGERVLLGLAGPPAAGKSVLATTLVQHLRRRLGANVVGYVPLDGFHLSNAILEWLGRRNRKGAPDTFDAYGYLALLRRILQEPGDAIYVPDYDRELNEPVAARHVVDPETRLVVTEGNYLACPQQPWAEVRTLATELWYVESSDTVREQRLHVRQQQGGLSPEAAWDWVRRSDRPNGDLVKESRQRCDRIVHDKEFA
ncbi:nucleoside/nucleotide kinase family protein [Lipingzhangella sp. LS1_29]|uniref:Nucleoside/nucleotide kinase family protein n=1 Tax=Lipingzhangella rawalii TaxID=2055835 RepID=A0ABU2H2J8_9ACTN|nr:nucleoside/nucleotide kinase family protein [Lipingzhangella rawalii]MDS1269045.1 nucleoside/nucleotide kinase family protein [Lipingzhangella rawalii]